MSGFLVRLVLLSGVWLLALGDVSFGDLVIGLLLSGGLLWLLGYHHSSRTPHVVVGRVMYFVPFACAALYQIILGTIDVSAVILGRREAKPAYVAVPIGDRTPNGVAVTTWLTTLIPGSALVEIEDESSVMVFHVLDVAEPGQFIDNLDRFYQRYQRQVFP
ncbi:MAG: Na+/H+ antiporter subunit E [Thermomicrobiales bacterium]|nr:Na+/H+ antiporter subunit E [Thermomicrobiales bacterium]